MIAPSFANVSATAKFTLADLSVTGYTESKWDSTAWSWLGGCTRGAFQLKVLKNDGSTDALYSWVDCKSGWSETTPDVFAPGWYTNVGTEYTKLTDEETKAIVFDQGQAFWMITSGYKLVSAGQVTKEDLELKTNKENHTPFGNGMPMELTLGDLSVTGYTESKWDSTAWSWLGGCTRGAFQLKLLKNDGSTDALYSWVDCKSGWSETTPEVFAPGWYTNVGTEYTKLTEEETKAIKIPAGQGFWIIGSGYSLVVPAPEL